MIETSDQLTLELGGPIVSSTTGTPIFGVDLSTFHWNSKASLSSTLIKGNIRHELIKILRHYQSSEHTLTQSDINQWFGPADHDTFDPHKNPKPAAIDFGFVFTLTASEILDENHQWIPHKLPPLTPDNRKQPIPQYRFRAEQDQYGKIKPKMLLKLHDYFGAGTRHRFTGTLYGKFADTTEQQRFEHWLNKALHSVQALGALRSIGFGELTSFTLKPDSQSLKTSSLTAVSATSASAIECRLQFDRPLCANTLRRANSNAIVSADAIPGSTLLAVIKRRLDELAVDQSNFDFDRFHMSFAQPAKPGAHPGLPKPLSLVYFTGDDQTLYDLCQQPEPQLIDDHGSFASPLFHTDWKPRQHENNQVFNNRSYQPLAKPERHLQVRTAINSNTGAAEEGRLFSMECVDTETHEWVASLELNQTNAAAEKAAQLALDKVFSTALDGIGKTRARASVEITSRFQQTIPFSTGDYTIVMLLSPCRMLDENPVSITSTNLIEAYGDYWCNLGFTLNHFYATEQLEGGKHYYHHYLKKHQPPLPYSPAILTTAGSVFALQATHESQHRQLAEYLKLGLPPAARSEPRNWKTDPFIRENGYGQITINYPDLGCGPARSIPQTNTASL